MTHILIVSARFYPDISALLEAGAVSVLNESVATHELLPVPGAFEVPAAIRFALTNKKYDGFIALGCVIRGETTHYDYVCSESARGLMDLSLNFAAAVANGILTVENEVQAKHRADPAQGNKGGDVARAVLRMIELKRKFGVTT